MEPKMKRILLTMAIVLLASSVAAITILGPGRKQPAPKSQDIAVAASQTETKSDTKPETKNDPAAERKSETDAASPKQEPARAAPAAAPSAAAAVPAATPAETGAPSGTAKYSVRPPLSAPIRPDSIGSLDPAQHRFRVDFAPTSAGIDRIVFSEFWLNAQDRIAAERHVAAVAGGSIGEIPPLPPIESRYQLQSEGKLAGFSVPLLAMHSIIVDGVRIDLFSKAWMQSQPGEFVAIIDDAQGQAVLRVRRAYSIIADAGGGFDVRLEQGVENLSGIPRQVQIIHYAPSDLARSSGEMMDIRRLKFGYLLSTRRDPAQVSVLSNDAMLERADVVKSVDAGRFDVWPNEQQRAEEHNLSWFGATNRYFALALHALPTGEESATGGKSIARLVEVVRAQLGSPAASDPTGAPSLFAIVQSPMTDVQPGATADFSVGVFAGPLDRNLLSATVPYSLLEMVGLIAYSLGGCCAWCTFAWLANILVEFLGTLHAYLVFDWGIAIIVLVMVVRLLLHPISKKSQVQMQRISKGMAALKPELDALKARYGDDPKRMQQEQFRLYREKNINPVGCLGGFLPTFLQMPIWMALYAVLYLAFELRQQPAFFGVFQVFGGWQFLGDLSAQDRFIPLPFSVNLFLFTLSSINIIPLLMGVVFYVQQKYMAPPTAQLSPEQAQQQKMMRVMTVVMFPLMLYVAPSGLTLYIMTSTLIGIWESKMVRRQVEEEERNPRPVKTSKAQDVLGRIYQKAMERAQEKQQRSKTFKDRG
jgi:YidC/Oxa1 family membrane protein insertase